MRKNTVISFIGLLFCLCIQAQGTSTSVNSTVNDVDWARAEKFSSDALEQESRVTHSTQGIYSFTGIDLRRMTSTAFILIRKESLWCMICAPEY